MQEKLKQFDRRTEQRYKDNGHQSDKATVKYNKSEKKLTLWQLT